MIVTDLLWTLISTSRDKDLCFIRDQIMVQENVDGNCWEGLHLWLCPSNKWVFFSLHIQAHFFEQGTIFKITSK